MLYSVTMVHEDYLDDLYVPSPRTVAICETIGRASEILYENECDIRENSYDLAVIEMVIPGSVYNMQARTHKQWWYEWDEYESGYVPIEQPERFSHIINWFG